MDSAHIGMPGRVSHVSNSYPVHPLPFLREMGFDECEQQLLELAEAQTQYGVTLYPVMVRACHSDEGVS